MPVVAVHVDDLYFKNKSNKCRYLWITLLMLLIIVTVLIIFYFTMLQPKLPHFYVNALSLTNFTSTEIVTGTWQVVFLVKNPNEFLNIKFMSLQPMIYYEDQNLSESQIISFMQPSKSNLIFNVTFSAVNVKVGQYILDGMNKEREHGSVGFNVKIDGYMKLKYSKQRIRVLCDNIVVRISSNSLSGILDGGVKNCNVDFN
ncbi:hypothetical protein TanjilG_30952 [Lupinus angustifolius]|uniref:Late embryogenesis abundant protein LEA-2 subgroup domain-containing protein n=1 Tax=Lupinus angustifolius TaxID=3871 RepID=A0A1J7GSY5_LUPAN|nr:PREDICTED: NDR1/HIN1-Like protein 3-like [Lupinus angustifolius]OIW03532.1 hypothetical protein TanjilG_30952 [Lupinus angustifolius]